MKLLGWMMTGIAAGWLATAGGALAEEEKSKANPIDQSIADLEKSIANLTGISLNGMLYFSWLYNFNRPQDGQNSLRSLDNRDNQLYVDLFQLQLSRQLPGGLSLTTKLDVGNTATRIGADWNGEGEFSGVTGNNSAFEIEEAYAVYAPEWARGWQVKGGKFVTLLGAEVIEAPSNMNFSRSFLFGFAIPFTHTGMLVTPPLGDHFAASIGWVNGWDNVGDNNGGKTLIGSVGWIPSSQFSLYVNGTFGPEQTNKNNNPRGVGDVVSTITLDPVTISLNGDYGHEDQAALNGTTEKWYGFSGIIGLTLKDLICIPAGVYVRGEWFRDSGGGRTGADQTLDEATFTAKYFVTDKLTLWAEYRHDWSTANSFEKNGTVTTTDPTTGEVTTSPRFRDAQDTVALAASYLF
jgi:Putative beta-barrel porin-2, OmpL-like. bbp2